MLGIVPVPYGGGGPSSGPEMGPQKLYELGILEETQARSFSNIHVARENNCIPLVLGGDHTVVFDNIMASASRYPDLGILWIDAHCDLNDESTSPSGNEHGMILNRIRQLVDAPTVILGARSIDIEEDAWIDKFRIWLYSAENVVTNGILPCTDSILNFFWYHNVQHLHISVDLDVLNPRIYPGVTVPEEGGMYHTEPVFAIQRIKRKINIVSMDIVELDPSRDSEDNYTAKAAIRIANSVSD